MVWRLINPLFHLLCILHLLLQRGNLFIDVLELRWFNNLFLKVKTIKLSQIPIKAFVDSGNSSPYLGSRVISISIIDRLKLTAINRDHRL